MSLIECVPNFSEGRRPEVVQALVDAIESVRGARVIDRSMDASHNRAVVTFVAPPSAVADAAFRAIQAAAARIDLRKHEGEHPRIGATDVVPFVPLEGATMGECIAIAHALGARVARELSIPVYFYESAARRPERKNLPDVRNIGFEKLRDAIAVDPTRVPDEGPAHVHDSAGATVIGARSFLIAYNINLESADVKLAKDIAKRIRERDGGLPGIKAMGFFLDDQKVAQVSMNVCDFERTGLVRVYEEVERLCGAAGVAIRESELVGLAPRAALPAGVAQRIRLARFDPRAQIVEERVVAAAGA